MSAYRLIVVIIGTSWKRTSRSTWPPLVISISAAMLAMLAWSVSSSAASSAVVTQRACSDVVTSGSPGITALAFMPNFATSSPASS